MFHDNTEGILASQYAQKFLGNNFHGNSFHGNKQYGVLVTHQKYEWS